MKVSNVHVLSSDVIQARKRIEIALDKKERKAVADAVALSQKMHNMALLASEEDGSDFCSVDFEMSADGKSVIAYVHAGMAG